MLVVAGPLHAAERRYAVAGFDRIALSGSPEVTVRSGLQPSVVATGSSRVLDTLEVSVVGGELRIVPHERRWNLGWLGGEQPTRVTVTLPVLRAATIEGSGSITAPGVRAPAFAAVVNGSGHIVAEGLASSQVSATINGSGTIRVAGRLRPRPAQPPRLWGDRGRRSTLPVADRVVGRFGRATRLRHPAGGA